MNEGYYKRYEPFFQNWYIVKKIGEGSYGKVFEIERREQGHIYHAAMKAITIPASPRDFAEAEEKLGEQGAVRYFRGIVDSLSKEFQIMADLSGNTNIVSYYDHYILEHEDGHGWDIFIRMELLTPLRAYLKGKVSVSRREIIKLGMDMCCALQVCQKHDIVHRDIKPDNIFRTENGDYKLGDFGVARVVEQDNRTKSMSIAGTLQYMAPELVHMEPNCDSRIDIYSLGIVLYELLNTNRLPFLPPYPQEYTAQDAEQAYQRRIYKKETLPYPQNAQLPKRIGEIVLKACAWDKKERYFSPGDLLEDLKAIYYPEDGENILVDNDTWPTLRKTIMPKQNPKPVSKRKWLWMVSVGAGVAALVAVLIFGASRKADDRTTEVPVEAEAPTVAPEIEDDRVMVELTLMASDASTPAGHFEDVEIVKQRLRTLAGDESLVMSMEGTELFVSLPWEECFGTIDVASVIPSCINRPMELYVTTNDAGEAELIKIAREAILDAEVVSGELDGVDFSKYGADDTKEFSYIKLTIQDEVASQLQNLVDAERELLAVFDCERVELTYSLVSYPGIVVKDGGKSIYLILTADWAMKRNVLETMVYCLKNPALHEAMPYNYTLNPLAEWESQENGLMDGEMQVEVSELSGTQAIISLVSYADEEDREEDVALIKLGLDAIGEPYAIGRRYDAAGGLVIRTSAETMGIEVINMLSSGFDLESSSGDYLQATFKSATVEKTSEGNYCLILQVDDYSIADITEASKSLLKKGYFYLGDRSGDVEWCSSQVLTEINQDGRIVFDQLPFLEQSVITQEHRFLLDLLCARLNARIAGNYSTSYYLEDIAVERPDGSTGTATELGVRKKMLELSEELVAKIKGIVPEAEVSFDPEDGSLSIDLHSKIEDGFLKKAVIHVEDIFRECDFDAESSPYESIAFRLIDNVGSGRCMLLFSSVLKEFTGRKYMDCIAVCEGGLLDSYTESFMELLKERYFFTIRSLEYYGEN